MKIGIVGGYGHAIVRVLPGANLAWACDEYDQAALTQAQAVGCSQTYSSMEEMLEKFSPDLVYIGTVYAQNGSLAIRALERGFDVLAEKPLATDWKTYDRLKELTASGDRRVIAELAMRWTPALQKIRQIFRQGRIGDPVMIQAQKTYKFGSARPEFYKSRELFGGIIPWVAVHAIDFASWSTGLRFRSVSAQQGNRRFPEYHEMEDHAAMFFEMTGGIPCLITADFLRPQGASSHSDDRLRITGTEGVLELQNETVSLIDAQGEDRWDCPLDDSSGICMAEALVAGARGEPSAEISTAECLHITAAALAARDAASKNLPNHSVPDSDQPDFPAVS